MDISDIRSNNQLSNFINSGFTEDIDLSIEIYEKIPEFATFSLDKNISSLHIYGSTNGSKIRFGTIARVLFGSMELANVEAVFNSSNYWSYVYLTDSVISGPAISCRYLRFILHEPDTSRLSNLSVSNSPEVSLFCSFPIWSYHLLYDGSIILNEGTSSALFIPSSSLATQMIYLSFYPSNDDNCIFSFIFDSIPKKSSLDLSLPHYKSLFSVIVIQFSVNLSTPFNIFNFNLPPETWVFINKPNVNLSFNHNNINQYHVVYDIPFMFEYGQNIYNFEKQVSVNELSNSIFDEVLDYSSFLLLIHQPLPPCTLR